MVAQHWAATLASALVTRGPLFPIAKEGLEAAFPDRTEFIVFCLANGDAAETLQGHALEAFTVFERGRPADTVSPAAPGISSALIRQVQSQDVLVLTASDDNPEWQELRRWWHADWLVAAPLCARGVALAARRRRELPQHCVLGALLVAGRGEQPAVDAGWVRRWALEMGEQVSHASIQLMECSLEVLGALFPPRVLEKLVLNAASKAGRMDLATVLRDALAEATSAPPRPPSSADSSAAGVGSASVSASGTAPNSARSSQEGRPPRPPSALPDGGFAGSPAHRQVSVGAAAAAGVLSPFAEQSALRSPGAPRSPSSASEATPQLASGPLPPSTAALLSQASRGSTASAILRQVSLHSDVSRLFSESAPASPQKWEVEGYEDILEEDHHSTLSSRASLVLDGAAPAPPKGHSPLQEAAAGLVAGGDGEAAREAAAGAPPHEALAAVAAAGEEGTPLLGPGKTAPPPAGPGAATASGLCGNGDKPSASSTPFATPPAASLASTRSAASDASGAAHAAAAVHQDRDLTFASPSLEAGYRAWVWPHLHRSDALLGAVHWGVAASLAARLALLRCAPLPALLCLAGVVLTAAPGLAATLRPSWWARRRTAALAALRLLATVLLAAQLVAVAQGGAAGVASQQLTWLEAVLGRSGAAALCLLPMRLPLSFALHLPLHLLCLWVVTAAASLAHMHGGGAAPGDVTAPLAPLPVALLAQLAAGFLLSSWLVYRREQHLRARFLGSRQAAACLAGARQGHKPSSLASGSEL